MPDRRRGLLVASGGGHWVQLLRRRMAWEGHDVAYATVQPDYAVEVAPARFYVVADATRWDRLKLLKMVCQIVWILLRERPQVVVTTGAAPGAVALRLARFIGARTVWIDSIANVEAMSMSGAKVGPHTDLWLTQWAHLAGGESGPRYEGSVL